MTTLLPGSSLFGRGKTTRNPFDLFREISAPMQDAPMQQSSAPELYPRLTESERNFRTKYDSENGSGSWDQMMATNSKNAYNSIHGEGALERAQTIMAPFKFGQDAALARVPAQQAINNQFGFNPAQQGQGPTVGGFTVGPAPIPQGMGGVNSQSQPGNINPPRLMDTPPIPMPRPNPMMMPPQMPQQPAAPVQLPNPAQMPRLPQRPPHRFPATMPSPFFGVDQGTRAVAFQQAGMQPALVNSVFGNMPQFNPRAPLQANPAAANGPTTGPNNSTNSPTNISNAIRGIQGWGQRGSAQERGAMTQLTNLMQQNNWSVNDVAGAMGLPVADVQNMISFYGLSSPEQA